MILMKELSTTPPKGYLKMNYGREIGFLTSVIATAFILLLIPVDASRVALLRLDHALNFEPYLRDDIARHCRALAGRPGNAEEKFFTDKFPLSQKEGNAPPCTVSVASSSFHRFFLRSYWDYVIRVQPENAPPFFEKNYHVQFPRPLCLLPVALFLLALVFGFRSWGMGCMLVSYVFLLAGANLIRATELIIQSSVQIVTSEQTFPGLCLMLLWLAAFLSRKEEEPLKPRPIPPYEKVVSRAGSAVIGFWNPAVYTLLGRLAIPLRGTVSRLTPFLDAQLLVACLSLYLFSPETRKLPLILEESLSLPRYFSFSIILFVALTYFTRRKRPDAEVSPISRLWIAAAFIITGELLAWRFKAFVEIPTLVRVGAELLCSELIRVSRIDYRRAARVFLPWAGALFVSSFGAVLSQRAGITDLALAMSMPQVHPTLFILFTFLSGLTLGFLTGSFGTSFFVLVLTIHSHDFAQSRAALLDGILAGTLLSPFSLFNLLPSAQFEIPIQKLVAFRWRQLAVPFLIGSIIYSISAINSVAILQPVTFVFLCLLALTIQLKKRTWTIGVIKTPEFMETT